MVQDLHVRAPMTFGRDIRFGLRVLVRNPGFAAAAIAVMSLGIGVTTAVFSVVRGVLLEPLPYREPDRLVLARADAPGYTGDPLLTGEEFLALRGRTDLFESVGSIYDSEGNLTAPDDMEAVSAASVSPAFLQTLGVSPILGSAPTDAHVVDGWVHGVNISYDVWQRTFGGDPHVVGRTIEVNNIPMVVAGVLPSGFNLYLGHGIPVATSVDIWFPQGPTANGMQTYRDYVTVARLRRSVTIEAAQSAVDAMMTTFVAEHPGSYRAGTARVRLAGVERDLVSDVRPALLALAGSVAFVLLVACANLTNLLLARATARARELAIRTSIGASRGRLVRQLLAEGLTLGAIGACGGLLLADWSIAALLALSPALPNKHAIGIDAAMAVFAVALALLTALVVSLLPAWQATRADVSGSLKVDPNVSRRAASTRGLLVAAQLALSLILLVGAGLMTRAFSGLRSAPLGFDPRGALTMNVHLQVQRFNTGPDDEARARRLAFYRQLRDAVSRMPGIERVGIGLPVPMAGAPLVQRFSAGPAQPERQAEAIVAMAGYLESLRVPLVAGRFFTALDEERPAAVVDESVATSLWPGESPIGHRLLLSPNGRPLWAEVVGIAAHVRMRDVRGGGLPQLWLSYAAKPYSDLNIVVRGANARGFATPVERAVADLHPGRPVHDVRMLDEYVAASTAPTRFAVFVFGSFALLAVSLSAIGVYAVAAYAAARRTREIAVRLALGASGRQILGLITRGSVGWIAGGLLAGAAGARLLTKYLEALLFGVRPGDPATFGFVCTLLGAIALGAVMLPAIRAVRIDPMLSLRAE